VKPTNANYRRWLCGLMLTCLSISASGQTAISLIRERQPQQRPTLLIVGAPHFDNPGRDVINSKVDDVLSPEQQASLAKVVDALAAFRPDYVAVEWTRSNQDKLNARYRDYREGRYTLSRDERDQLGLRLAAKLNLPQVTAVDWNEEPPGEENHYDWLTYGEANGQAALISAIRDPNRSGASIPQGTQRMATWLLKLNGPDALAAMHRDYFDIAMVGDAKDQPGANWVGTWYARNLRIFNNLVNLTDRPEKRILVIYGRGHAYLLRQFARESGAFRLMDLDQVLKD
jgi:Family of unknown function (DUF5694)